MYDGLSKETIADCVNTLRYLKRQFEISGRLDGLNMAHVHKALDRVDIEISFARQADFDKRTAAPSREAAE